MTNPRGVMMTGSQKKYAVSLLCVLALFMPFALQLIPWFEWSDGCEHAAAIRELTYSLFHPLNPYLNLPGNTSPRYVPSIIIMAIAEKILGCDVFTMLGFFSVAAFLFLGRGIYLFAKEYFQDDEQPVYTLLSLLFLWGRGWDGANSIMFSSLVYNAYYPSVISLVFVFYALTAQLKYLRQCRPRYFIEFAVFGSLLFLNHQPTGFLFFFMAFLLFATEGYLNKRNALLFSGAFVLAVLVTAWWPYYSFFKGVLFMLGGKGKQFWDYQSGHQLHYSGHLARIGPCFLGMLTVAYFGLKKKYPFIVFGFIASLVFYILGYFFTIILFERLIFLCLLFSQLAFSRMLKNILQGGRDSVSSSRRKILRVVYVSALGVGIFVQFFLIGTVYVSHYIAWQPRVHLKPYQHPLQQYIALRPHLRRGDIVLTDVFTSWVIPGVTDVKVISVFHNSPFVLENFERLHDTRIFFNDPARREELLAKYKISHILINKKRISTTGFSEASDLPCLDKEWMRTLAGLGTVTVNNENFFLVEVKKHGRARGGS
jgi:hypothetical protein